MAAFQSILAAKVAKLIRLLASDKPGEILAAVEALRRTLESAGADLHAIADAIEQPNGKAKATFKSIADVWAIRQRRMDASC